MLPLASGQARPYRRAEGACTRQFEARAQQQAREQFEAPRMRLEAALCVLCCRDGTKYSAQLRPLTLFLLLVILFLPLLEFLIRDQEQELATANPSVSGHEQESVKCIGMEAAFSQ